MDTDAPKVDWHHFRPSRYGRSGHRHHSSPNRYPVHRIASFVEKAAPVSGSAETHVQKSARHPGKCAGYTYPDYRNWSENTNQAPVRPTEADHRS